MDDFARIESASQFLLLQSSLSPTVGLVLGSGLAALPTSSLRRRVFPTQIFLSSLVLLRLAMPVRW